MLKAVLHLHGSEEVLRARMLKRSGIEDRVDDTVEIHKQRLQDFMEQSPEIISFYQKENKYSKVIMSRKHT